jgi:hypothetical protein
MELAFQQVFNSNHSFQQTLWQRPQQPQQQQRQLRQPHKLHPVHHKQ